ncbi:nuclear transport factor 2 family protein [Nocardiopsis changdeensis]|uniref:Nuclear transport factor 2 family protein n=1 Tax=Nocardiopsis changdeensis TaxID=2831969 RepID=A0ABX8BVF9_9ACTN|nr:MULTISPECIES: nuclear transport factor 2 family protein [Nocardiopsis]QUX24353.1 nuclear transport factor 2 family protein [Nocardiopsis changdeensis]QYX34744.1 nuclear transport factor 2 family protein [Nocardiopsis sp. MT53]
MGTFREAVEARDPDAVAGLLADDVVFTSPVAFRPHHGRAVTAAILRAVLEVFEDFRYVGEYTSDDGREHVLRFRASVSGREVEGCDLLHYADDGRVDALTVMVRPLSGLQALADAMNARFDRIREEAASAG